MDDAVRRAALRATAKVALSLTVFGCAGQVLIEPTPSADPDLTPDPEGPAPDPEDPTRSGIVSVPADDPPPLSELACQAPAPGQPVGLEPEQLSCCTDLLAPEVPHDGQGWDAWNTSMQDPDVQGCCNVLVAHVDADWSNSELLGYEAVSACCVAIGNPAGAACTPWGPPAPPTFDPELALAWGLA